MYMHDVSNRNALKSRLVVDELSQDTGRVGTESTGKPRYS